LPQSIYTKLTKNNDEWEYSVQYKKNYLAGVYDEVPPSISLSRESRISETSCIGDTAETGTSSTEKGKAGQPAVKKAIIN